MTRQAGLVVGILFLAHVAAAQFTQQGSKLVGTGATGTATQGTSVAFSADGNTAIVSGSGDSSSAGAAWVFTRSGGVWSQQGSKLVGTGAVGTAQQGYSVAISADASTAIVGGIGDSSFAGAAWVFISSVSATQLAFVQQPTSATAGTLITPAVTVQLEDSGGNPVAQSGVTITMSLSSGTGTLGGTLSQATNASGLATFNDLSIILVGSKQLTAASTGLTSAVSNAFTITAAAAVNIVVTGGTPQSTPINTPFAQPLQVAVTDTFGNPVVGALVTYSAPSSGASASLSNGGNATTDASGHASVTATANGIVGGPYLVSATTGTLELITFSLTNQQGAENAIPTLGGLGLLGLALVVLLVGAIVLA
jgi:adhesin/invasin